MHMKTTDPLNVKLQAAILQLGRLLASRENDSSPSGKRSPSPTPDPLAVEAERVMGLVRASPARRLFGIQSGFVVGDDLLRLKAVALLGWRMVGEATSCNPIVEVVAAVVDADSGTYCEQILLARNSLAQMVCDGLLVIVADSGGLWEGNLILPKRTFSWLCGGISKDAKGEFDPG